MVMFVKVVILFCIGHVATCGFAALNDNLRTLSVCPICFLYPRGLNMKKWGQAYPQTERMEVSSDGLGMNRSIQGDDEMMVSKKLYDVFFVCEYILICHTNAWRTRDELAERRAKRYDVVAASWFYRYFPLKHFIWLKGWTSELGGGNSRVRMYGWIGNSVRCHGFTHKGCVGYWKNYVPCVKSALANNG